MSKQELNLLEIIKKLTKKLANAMTTKERDTLLEVIRSGSVITWQKLP